MGRLNRARLQRVWAHLEVIATDPRKMLLVDISLGLMIAALAAAFLTISLQTHDALCTLRGDLEKRADDAEQFLTDHPKLKSFHFGPVVVTRGYLALQVKNQKSTLRALDTLNC